MIQSVGLLNHTEKEEGWDIENVVFGAPLISLGQTTCGTTVYRQLLNTIGI